MGLYIIIKKKGSKRPFGAVQAKKGVSVSNLRKGIIKSLKPGFVAKIVTKAQLKRLVLKTPIKSRVKRKKKR